MEDLRECPCCGKAAQGKSVYYPGRIQGFMRGWVGCPACGLYIQWTHDPSGAIRKWNRRAALRRSPTTADSLMEIQVASAGTGSHEGLV